jgi:bifunctional ADP-heptose synthase (sugar kinase/adenylyltransferase)
VVEEFYAAINDHNYASAWALGGDNLGGTYAAFVQGYSNTAYDTITSISGAGDTVYMNLVATDDSGAQTSYSVTYTVSGGVIVSGSGTQTS